MEAPQGGFFLPNVPFQKPALSLPDQVALLNARGMTIEDNTRAERYLGFIGYYRLSGYWRYFADYSDPKLERFRAGSSFEQVLNLYTFDRKLRLLFVDALERIEVAVKASLSNHACLIGGPFWLCNAASFDHGRHSDVLEIVDRAVGETEGSRILARPASTLLDGNGGTLVFRSV